MRKCIQELLELWHKLDFAPYLCLMFVFCFSLTQDKKTELIDPEIDESKVRSLLLLLLSL